MAKMWWSEVAQLCPTLCDPMDYSLPCSSLHGIFQARVLEWGVISFSRGSSRPRDRTQVSRIAGSQREELRPWQRSWGRRLLRMQRRNRASGNPLFLSIYPQNQSLPTLLFHALTYTSDFTGGCSPTNSLGEGVNLQLQLIKIPGHDECFNLQTPLKVL